MAWTPSFADMHTGGPGSVVHRPEAQPVSQAPVGVVFSAGTGDVLSNVTVSVHRPPVSTSEAPATPQVVTVHSNTDGEYRIHLVEGAIVLFNATGHQVLRMRARDLVAEGDCAHAQGCLADVTLIPLDYTMWSCLRVLLPSR